MKTKPIAALLTAVLAAPMVFAQPPGPKPSPEPSAKPRPVAEKPEPPPRPGQLANVRIDVKITDERAGQPPIAKLVSLTVADRRDGFVRTSAVDSPMPGPIPLNVDASPIIEGAHIRLNLSLQYTWVDETASGDARQRSRRDFQQRLGLVLEDGKTVRAAQSADPLSDRHVNLEVTATILP
jgi:hypothetical protein